MEVWSGICERLKFTAHKEGQPLSTGQMLIQFPGAQDFGIPTIALVYTVLGDTVTVHKILIRI
jgi:hypothetical protein